MKQALRHLRHWLKHGTRAPERRRPEWKTTRELVDEIMRDRARLAFDRALEDGRSR